MSTSKSGSKETADSEISWQAQKSAMTRDRIMSAAIRCFIEEGYSNLTTAKVATEAGVSRGAMLHHFPSKTELISATVEYLHDQLLEDYTRRVRKIPTRLQGAARRRAGLDAYWGYLTDDLFITYHELCVAGRTNPELQAILEESQAQFETHVAECNKELFSEWVDRGDRFLLAMDVTKFLMEGMAVGQPGGKQKERVARMMDYLADRLEEIFEDENSSAISRHS